MKKISIVLPSFNEHDSLEKTINEILSEQKNIPGFEIHIVVSDDVRTTDQTEELVNNLIKKDKRIHYFKTEPGIGVALIKGHQYALEHIKPDILAQMDADGQVEADVIPRMVKAIDQEGYNFAIGSRFVSGGKNKLSFSRRLFSAGSSVVCRIIMGPWDILEFTNSARALTPELFKKINLNRLPWKERSFINQPAFLNEAILAGAKYKEVPLVFKDRAEGYSKNKIINYTYDILTYAIDARLHKWGLDIPLFYMSRRAKTMIKFGVVGIAGTLVDFLFYNIFISYLAMRPATAKGFSTEVAIINNFIFNNYWTFKYRKTKKGIWNKFLVFNLVSLGGLVIGVLIVKLLHTAYGDGVTTWLGINIPYYNVYFFVAIPPVMIWNFTVNHLVTWKNKGD